MYFYNHRYRNTIYSPAFLAVYVYMQIFSYIIYFGLIFLVLVLPFQELFWYGLFKYLPFWLPVVALIMVNTAVRKLMMTRLELATGQYRGIPHPRLYSIFDTLNTVLSCIVGWAPAIVRIVASSIVTLIVLPRLDLKLPGGEYTLVIIYNGYFEILCFFKTFTYNFVK